MKFRDGFAVLLLCVATFVTILHAIRIPVTVEGTIQTIQVVEVPEIVLGALWGSGVVLAVQFYFRKAPKSETQAG